MDEERQKVFKRKVLELHHHDMYGEGGDDDSSSSTDSCSEDDMKHCNSHSRSPVTMATEPTRTGATTHTTNADDQLDQSVQDALGVLTAHRRFLDRQSMLADQHRKRNRKLPRTVSSKRTADIANVGEEKEEEEKGKEGCGQRKVTQAEKNKKRKLKKRKAKEKRLKLQDT